MSKEHRRRGQVESVVGWCLFGTGRRWEILSLLRSGHDKLRRALGGEHPETARARRRPAEASEAEGGSVS